MTDFIFNLNQPGDICYDIETYPNIFTFRCKHAQTGQRWNFEISQWIDNSELLCMFIERCRDIGCRWVGFNNLGFDYPVVHWIYLQHRGNMLFTVDHIYQKAMSIILNHNPKAKFAHIIWERDQIVQQLDLFKIHHFDNKAKSTSLKVLEFNMRMESIEDLPFAPGTVLTRDQADMLCQYNDHDVDATVLFYEKSKAAIELRELLSKEYNMNMMNCSDVKMGEKILVHEMEQSGIECYEWQGSKKVKKQTKRERIDINQVIFPYIKFERKEFRDILDYLKSQVITQTKGAFKDLIATVEGIEYKFGTGGLHASISSSIVRSTDTHQLIDIDVASFYPNLAIKNRLYPAHLGEAYCDVTESMFERRKTYPKSDPRNGSLKLAMNGAYGLSNNEYSPILDGAYTMGITINGQLLLAMLIEQLVKVPGLQMIQANTDGVTYLCPREHIEHTRNLARWWEGFTGLELEEAQYKRMFIRDVNNYIAEKEDGKLKRIGAYAYETAEENAGTRELPWHKDWSARVVQMAAEAHLVHGTDISEFLQNHEDIFDFFLRTKVPRSSKLEHGGHEVGNIVRYYLSSEGAPLQKVSPPTEGYKVGEYKKKNGVSKETYHQYMDNFGNVWNEAVHTKNKSVYDTRYTGIHTGWNVTLCNDLEDKYDDVMSNAFTSFKECFFDINYDWYIKEAQKLTLLATMN